MASAITVTSEDIAPPGRVRMPEELFFLKHVEEQKGWHGFLVWIAARSFGVGTAVNHCRLRKMPSTVDRSPARFGRPGRNLQTFGEIASTRKNSVLELVD